MNTTISDVKEDIPDWSDEPEMDEYEIDGHGDLVEFEDKSKTYEIMLDDGSTIHIPKEEIPLLAMESREQLYEALGYKKVKVGWDGENPGPLTIELDDGSIQDTGAEDTGRVLITQNGEYIADVSNTYGLVPNELIAQLGDKIADIVGAKVFNDKSTRTKLFRYYLMDNHVGPNGELKMGFLLVNSMDTSTSYRFQAFMYRSVCQNGMIFGKQALGSVWARHTSGLEIRLQSWYEAALTIIKKCKELGKAFERFPNIRVGSEEGQKILKRLKQVKIPNSYRPDYLKLPDTRIKEEEIPAPDPGMTLWEVYNDLTANFTRPTKKDGSARNVSEQSRIQLHTQLEKAILPALTV